MAGGVRFALPDRARGVALVAMIVAHVLYWCDRYHLVDIDRTDGVLWRGKHYLIMALFCGVSGLSLHLALRHGLRPRIYWHGCLRLGLAALAISVLSWFLFGPRWVFFGVLHLLLVARLTAPAWAHWPTWLLAALGALVVSAGFLLEFADLPAVLRPLGLAGRFQPRPVDYAPLAPYLGLVLLGVALGRWWYADRDPPPMRPESGPVATLSWLGRHSLAVYLLHQPVVFALVTGFYLAGWSLGWWQPPGR